MSCSNPTNNSNRDCGAPRDNHHGDSRAPAASHSIVVTDNDVLNGKGITIASHPGNQRFRSLVQCHQDSAYCSAYTADQKRAVAQKIIQHIRNLRPPGRFLKRQGKAKSTRGLVGPWEELSNSETLRKTCQALRDCNRSDRSGYAADVAAPEDVRRSFAERRRSRPRTDPAAGTPAAVLSSHPQSLVSPPLAATTTLPRLMSIQDRRLPHVTPASALSSARPPADPGLSYASAMTAMRPSTPTVEEGSNIQFDEGIQMSPTRECLEQLFQGGSLTASDDFADPLHFKTDQFEGGSSDELDPFDAAIGTSIEKLDDDAAGSMGL